ncbi:SDR family NAD(P)-dependent oxidoreductase [Adlercreutzia sp. ZJ473]|uniref:SDR family NAD(P)-dependent oxidoreductase n=1 Tax=Adlercreutzia sp. ZJ473 TaxID=2722822 RepID=UPI0015530DF2|nr:SDR family oxidoreductase [Adlercreutzia sp. ZJ473]
MQHDLTGKVCVVIGGGQTEAKYEGLGIGNGRATAIDFARHGAKVVVAAYHQERAQATVDMIKEEGNEAVAIGMDCSKLEDVKRLYDFAKETYGRIDFVVYNVGVNPNIKLGEEYITDEDWVWTMKTNLRGYEFCAHEILPYFKENGIQGGAMVAISSISSLISGTAGNPATLAYGLSKRGINMITNNYAVIGAPDNIRFNVVILGSVATPMATQGIMDMFHLEREQVEAIHAGGVPLKGERRGNGWDCADAAIFLADSPFITGAELVVDGGTTAFRGYTAPRPA